MSVDDDEELRTELEKLFVGVAIEILRDGSHKTISAEILRKAIKAAFSVTDSCPEETIAADARRMAWAKNYLVERHRESTAPKLEG